VLYDFGRVLAQFNNPGTTSPPPSLVGTNEPPTLRLVVDSATPRVRNASTDNIPRLESIGDNRAPWPIAVQSVCRSKGLDNLLTTYTKPTTSEEMAANRIVHHLLVSTIDHSLGAEVLKLATSHQGWSFLLQASLTTSIYDIIVALKTPTLHDRLPPRRFYKHTGTSAKPSST
jgi:hypothetical protein